MHDSGATIVAVATPPGRGAVGCVRLSGPAAAGIAGELFVPARPGARDLAAQARFGRFKGRDGRPVDHGYLTLFPPRRSFTGEWTAELWAHGSPAVLDELVAAAMAAGATLAEPGEFTYRALRNGRLDLTRAEAVRDLVEARTVHQARVALLQAEGALSRRLQPLRESLEEWIARGEAAIEFVDEAETHLPQGRLAEAVDCVIERCRELLAGAVAGRVVRDGAIVVLVGLPNVGKSSLFNRLLERDRAIVTPQAGTTRDTLEAELDVAGIPVRLVDTAGLREAGDEIEREGVRRAERARDEADFVLLVLDGSRELEPLERAALARARDRAATRRTVVVVNKCDLPGAAARALPHPSALRISARTGAGVPELKLELGPRLLEGQGGEDPVVTNRRHAAALEQVTISLERAREGARGGLPEELLLEDLRDAMRHLGEITGEFTTEALYNRIFSQFCLGK